MLKAFFVRLRRHRRPAVLLAAGLIILQAFLAGLTTAEAAIMSPELGAGLAVICHGNGASPDTGTAPDPAKGWHSCCIACAAGAGPAMLPTFFAVPGPDTLALPETLRLQAIALRIAPRAVRAGSSQAPPSHD